MGSTTLLPKKKRKRKNGIKEAQTHNHLYTHTHSYLEALAPQCKRAGLGEHKARPGPSMAERDEPHRQTSRAYSASSELHREQGRGSGQSPNVHDDTSPRGGAWKEAVHRPPPPVPTAVLVSSKHPSTVCRMTAGNGRISYKERDHQRAEPVK